MPVSTEKDFQSKIEKLENWLASKEGPLKLTPHESSMASGFSNETFVFDLEKEEFRGDPGFKTRTNGISSFSKLRLAHASINNEGFERKEYAHS